MFCSGLGYAWVYQGMNSNGNFLHLYQGRLNDMYSQEWTTMLSSSTRYEWVFLGFLDKLGMRQFLFPFK